MAVKLIDLQLIYGVAGAREKFEDLASQLVKAEQPDAGKIRIKQGDGGIDVYVGDMDHPDGIDIYQCKFFPQGLDDSQKEQIRKSYRTCRDSTKFRTKSWTLCLPVDLSLEEGEWFKEWQAKQAGSGIAIAKPWGALELERLLFLEKNRGLKEAFFKEEHLTQIREMHGMLHRLLTEIGERLRQDKLQREQTKHSDDLARQSEYLGAMLEDARTKYIARADEAARSGTQPGQRPHHWEIVVRPSAIPERPQISSLKECWATVQSCQVRSNGWEYPALREPRETGTDYVGVTDVDGAEVESWRLSQRGVFVHHFPIYDDYETTDHSQSMRHWRLPPGFVPRRFLHLDVAIRAITHVFRFAARLADKAFVSGDGLAEVSIRLTGTQDRVLVTTDDPRRLRECNRCTVPMLENTWPRKRGELTESPDQMAIRACGWFFERFGWHEVSETVLTNLQSRIFSKH